MLYAIITHFGLPAVFVGSGVEGEPFALAGGLLGHLAIVPLWAAVLAAIGGAFGIDLFWFTVGRRFRAHRRVRAISRQPAFATALGLIERHPNLAVVIFRFAYGLRMAAPIAVGTSAITTRRFVLTSLGAALLWGTGFTLIGYAFGEAASRWVSQIAMAGGLIGLTLLVITGITIARSLSASRA